MLNSASTTVRPGTSQVHKTRRQYLECRKSSDRGRASRHTQGLCVLAIYTPYRAYRAAQSLGQMPSDCAAFFVWLEQHLMLSSALVLSNVSDYERRNERMNSFPSQYDSRVYVSPAEAAEMLGIDRSTFYRRVMSWVYSGTIQSLKIGRCRRIRLASLLAWVECQENKEAIQGR